MVEAGKNFEFEMDCATVADGKLDKCIELSGEQIEMSGVLSIVRTDRNCVKLRLNKIEFFIGKCGNLELTAAMDFTKAKENKEFLLRTKPNGSQLDIKNTQFDCILKWLFFIDLHLN